jgi:alanine racemase
VTVETATRWADIDLEAIRHNVRQVARLVSPKSAVMAVVKANGYGHGAVSSARAALEGGATWLGVASVEEGLELRAAGTRAPILLLGYTPPSALGEAVAAGLSLNVFEGGTLDALRKMPLPAPARLQLKVDTGMNRLGVAPDEAVALARRIRQGPNWQLEAVWTHFASADSDPAFTNAQLAQFVRVRDQIKKDTGLRFLSHAANSAGLLHYPDARLDLVRAGLVVYGLSPEPSWTDIPGLRPALSWRTIVTNVHTVPEGAGVGYGQTWTAPAPRQVATLAVGYGDGLHRRHSNRGHVLLRGKRAPIVGTVSMDQTTVDVTEIPGVTIGDVATLIGRDGGSELSASAVAAAVDTIAWEVLCAISARVVRRYTDKSPRGAEELRKRASADPKTT